MCRITRTSVVAYNSSVPFRRLQVVIGFSLARVSGFRRPVYYPAQGRFFYPAFSRRAGGGTIMGTQGESQWAAARGLLSTLTTSGMIYGVWGNRNRMLRKNVFAILGTFSPSSQSDVGKVRACLGTFSLSRVSCGTFGVERKTSQRERR